MVAKAVAHATIGGGKRYDVDAILDDPRNWRGVQGQKQQAVLRQIVRQSNGPDKDAPEPFRHFPPPRDGMAVISLGAIEAFTGIGRTTVVPILDALAAGGFITVAVENPGTRQAVYRVGIRSRNAANWAVRYLHFRDDLNARGYLF